MDYRWKSKTCAKFAKLFRDWSSIPECHLLQPPGSLMEWVETHSEYHTSWNISIRESHNKPRSAVRRSTQLEIGIPSTSRDSGEHPKGSEEQSKLKLSSRKKCSPVTFLPSNCYGDGGLAEFYFILIDLFLPFALFKNYVIQFRLHLNFISALPGQTPTSGWRSSAWGSDQQSPPAWSLQIQAYREMFQNL